MVQGLALHESRRQHAQGRPVTPGAQQSLQTAVTAAKRSTLSMDSVGHAAACLGGPRVCANHASQLRLILYDAGRRGHHF